MKLLLSIFILLAATFTGFACPTANMDKVFPIAIIKDQLHVLELRCYRDGVVMIQPIGENSSTEKNTPISDQFDFTNINVVSYYSIYSKENKLITSIRLDSTYIDENKIASHIQPIFIKLIKKIESENPHSKLLEPLSIDHCNYKWDCDKVKFEISPNLELLYTNAKQQLAETKIDLRKTAHFENALVDNTLDTTIDTSSLFSFFTNSIRRFSDGQNTIEIIYINDGEIFRDYDEEGNEKEINFDYNKEFNPTAFNKSLKNTIYIDYILYHNKGTDLIYWF